VKRLLVILCAVAALGGCRSDPESGPARPTGDGPPEQPPAASASATDPPSGLVHINETGSTHDLDVLDPKTGALLATYPLGGYSVSSLKVESPFRPDRRYLQVDDPCKLVLLAWTGTGYAPHATWDPPESFGGGKDCYRNAHFRDGRLWAVVGPRNTSGPTATPVRIVSFDPADATAAPRTERDNVVPTFDPYTVEGGAMERTSIWVTGDVIGNFDVRQADGGTGYRCDRQITVGVLLCAQASSGVNRPFGSAATATVDVAGKRITMRKLAPPSAAAVHSVALSPDGKQVIAQTNNGWYLAQVGSGSEPVKAFEKLDLPVVKTANRGWIGWI
jgi:hypothetical protein